MTVPESLVAGALTAQLRDGELRYVSWHGREVLRRLAVVVRDANWGTISPVLGAVTATRSGDGFSVDAEATCDDGAVGMRWHLHVRATGASLDATVALQPLRPCLYNRAGLIALLAPGEVAGRPYRAAGPGGRTRGRLPCLVGPQPVVDGRPRALFAPFHRLTVELRGSVDLDLRFDGDEFELEDQRNWADGSLKAYSTPLGRGFPQRAHPARPPAPQRLRATLAQRDRVEVALGDAVVRPPAIGIALRAGLNARAAAAIRALRPAHIRLDAPLVAGALSAAAAVGAPVELLATGDDDTLPPLAARLERAGLRCTRVLCTEASPGAARRAFPGATVCATSLGHFAELNRRMPSIAGWDAAAFPCAPQAHASDDDTLREALEAIPALVATVAARAGVPAYISPLALKPVSGPGSQGGADPRLRTPFAAAWAVAAIAAATSAGCAGITAFEAVGRDGILDADGSPLPVCDALRQVVTAFAESDALAATVSDRRRLGAVGLRRADTTTVMAASVSDTDLDVIVAADSADLVDAAVRLPPFQVRMLEAHHRIHP